MSRASPFPSWILALVLLLTVSHGRFTVASLKLRKLISTSGIQRTPATAPFPSCGKVISALALSTTALSARIKGIAGLGQRAGCGGMIDSASARRMEGRSSPLFALLSALHLPALQAAYPGCSSHKAEESFQRRICFDRTLLSFPEVRLGCLHK